MTFAGNRDDDDDDNDRTDVAGTDPVRSAEEHMQKQWRAARQRDVHVRTGIRGRLLSDGHVRRLLRVRDVHAVGQRAPDVPVLRVQLRRPVRETAVRGPVPERRRLHDRRERQSQV